MNHNGWCGNGDQMGELWGWKAWMGWDWRVFIQTYHLHVSCTHNRFRYQWDRNKLHSRGLRGVVDGTFGCFWEGFEVGDVGVVGDVVGKKKFQNGTILIVLVEIANGNGWEKKWIENGKEWYG